MMLQQQQQHPDFKSENDSVTNVQAIIYNKIGYNVFDMPYKKNTTILENSIWDIHELGKIKVDVEKIDRLYRIFSDERHNFQLVARMIFNEKQLYINFVGNKTNKDSVKLFVSRDYLLFLNSQRQSIKDDVVLSILSDVFNEKTQEEKRKDLINDIFINFKSRKRQRGEEEETTILPLKKLKTSIIINSIKLNTVEDLYRFLEITENDLKQFGRYTTKKETNNDDWEPNELKNIKIDFDSVEFLSAADVSYSCSSLICKQKYKDGYIYMEIFIEYVDEEGEEKEKKDGVILVSKNPEYFMNEIIIGDCAREELYLYFEKHENFIFNNRPHYFCNTCENTFNHRK